MRLKLCFGLLIVASLLSTSSVSAAVYKWTDDQGRVHFTDSKSNIPLEYRNRIKRPRRMIEPPAPKIPEGAAETVADPGAVENPDATAEAEAPPAEVEEEPKEAMDPELAAMLNETKTFLEGENKKHQHLIDKIELNKFAGKVYMRAIRDFLVPKKELVQKLKKSKLPSLKAAQRFLQKSAQRDKRVEMGGSPGTDNTEWLLGLQTRMKREIKTKKKLIANLKVDLGEPAEKS